MIRRTLIAIAGTLALAAPASASWRSTIVDGPVSHLANASATHLVTPDGQPVRGPWQHWLDADPMPTYRGTMVLDVSTSDTQHYCTTPEAAGARIAACTFQPGPKPNVIAALSTAPETVLDPLANNPDGGNRMSLLYEQAHVLDFAYLSDAERVRFMHIFPFYMPAGATVQDQWWHGENHLATDYAPGEEFSQIYTDCALRPNQTAVDLDDTTRQAQRVCQMISHLT